MRATTRLSRVLTALGLAAAVTLLGPTAASHAGGVEQEATTSQVEQERAKNVEQERSTTKVEQEVEQESGTPVEQE